MRFIQFIPLCLVFVSSCLAATPHNINFQGNAGQYSFNYEEPLSSRSESRSSDGMTRGTYSYFDANGQLQTAEYEAGHNLGFNLKATNLPQAPLPVKEAPEILVARQKHLQLLEEANRQENNGAFQEINRDLPHAPGAIQRLSFLGDSLHLLDTTGAKKDSLKELDRPLGTQSAKHLPLNAPIAGAQLIPETNRKIFAFPGWRNEPISDFPANFLPKGSANSPNFQKGSANLPNFPKGYDHLPSLPMGDGNFNQFLKGNPEFSSLSKDTPVPLSSFSSFPRENTNFPSFPQLGPDFSLKGDFNSPPFLTSNEFSSSQKSGTDALPLSNDSPLLKGNTNFRSLPKIGSDFLPKGNFNFPPFLTSNEFSSTQKSATNALPSPFLKENLNFLSLSKIGADSSLLLNEKSDFMPSNGAFSSVPKSDANTEPLLKNDASSASFPKENVNSPLINNRVDTFPLLEGRVNSNPFLKDQVINNPLPKDKISPTLKSNVEGKLSPLPKSETPSTLSEETLKQRDAIAMSSTSENTPEAATARDAQLQSVTEIISKSSESSVIHTPEDLSARGAHLRFAADPEAARLFFQVPKFTPEVQAAREAHFRAHALAAKLAAESDINPKILELFLGRPGEPKLGSQKRAELENILLKGVTDEKIRRLMENPSMMMEAPMKGIDALKENMPMTNDYRGINNLMEKPQLKQLLKVPQIQLDSGITPAGTSLKIPDTRVASIDEFQQSKQKAEVNLICGTALKVKDLNDNKSEEDRRLIIVKSGNPTPFLGNLPLPIDQSEQWRNNWALQYMSV